MRFRIRKDMFGLAIARFDDYLDVWNKPNKRRKFGYQYGFIVLILIFEIYIPIYRKRVKY